MAANKASSKTEMKGIILAGGENTRLHPLTKVISKHLLPIYDKPMVYYPLSVLMLAGIRQVLIITTPGDRALFEQLLGDGAQWGLRLSYLEQPRPEGLAQGLVLGQPFIGDAPVCLVLGDTLLYGQGLTGILQQATTLRTGGKIFAYNVGDPERYGVIEFDGEGQAYSLEEKPAAPRSNWAVPGIYTYGPEACEIAAGLSPSPRGELEITDVNRALLERGELTVTKLGRGIAWLDMGTYPSMLEASNFIRLIEERQGLKVACLEEIAWRNGWITTQDVRAIVTQMGRSAYAEYLEKILTAG